MLYQPSFPNPYLNTIDANYINTFRFKVNGDIVNAYQIFIYNASTNVCVYNTGKIELTQENYVYGNDGDDSFIECSIDTSSCITNGLDYIWKVKLWQQTHDIEVVRGRVYSSPTGTGNLKIRPHIEDTVKKGMILRIGTNDYPISSCVLQYPKIYASANNSSENIIKVSSSANGAKELASGDYVTVGGYGNGNRKNTTTAQISKTSDDNKGTITITLTGDVVTSSYENITYIQKNTPSLYSQVTLDNDEIFPKDTISQGDEYIVLSNYVECDIGFYFKARTTPTLAVYNDGILVDSNELKITNSNIDIIASYGQDQGVSIKYWNAELISDNKTIYSTGDVYNSKIKISYDSLLPSQSYKLNLFVENMDGVTINKVINIFTDYNIANTFTKPKLKLVHNSAVEISWNELVNIYGESNVSAHDIEYDENNKTINLKDNQALWWDTLDSTEKLSMDSPAVISTLVTNIDNYNGSIIEISDSVNKNKIEVGYDSALFWWKINGSYEQTFNPYVSQDNAVGVLSTDPTNTLYLWNNSSSNIWNRSDSYYWHFNDVSNMYWWLIQINIYCEDYSKMVTFTKYKKE